MVIPRLAAIPAPPGNAIHVGPLQLRAYGLMIAVGVLAAVALARHRWVARGGNGDDITALAVWAVPAGLVGRPHLPRRDRSGAVPGPLVACLRGVGGRPRDTRRDRGGGHRQARWWPAGAVCRSPSCSTSSPRPCLSRRPSGAGATGSTRSSSGDRPRCRGRSGSIRRIGRAATGSSPRSIRRSSTSPCGTSAWWSSSWWSNAGSTFAPGRLFVIYVVATRSGGCGSRACGSTPPTASRVCG